jgi:hypothetical protein
MGMPVSAMMGVVGVGHCKCGRKSTLIFTIDDTGEGNRVLYCHTPYTRCCKTRTLGEW